MRPFDGLYIFMEVTLKKTKITNSILKQTLKSRPHDFNNSDVLGWCFFDKIKYMVIYQSSTNTLTKYPLFKSAEPVNSQNGLTIEVKVSIGGNYTPTSYKCESIEEQNKFIEKLKQVKNLAETRGQFFL